MEARQFPNVQKIPDVLNQNTLLPSGRELLHHHRNIMNKVQDRIGTKQLPVLQLLQRGKVL